MIMMKVNELAYGRPESEWGELGDACLDFLVERARVGLTNYTDLNRELVRRTGLAAFDFGQAADRAALGHLLGLVADRTFADTGLLISALVTYRHGDSPAAGFFSLAAEHGLIPAAATAFEREKFWSVHVRDLQGHYGRKPTA
jgi:hypothetical protein